MADFRPAGWTGEATALPQPVTLRRERRPVVLAVGVLVLAAGVIAVAVAIVGLVTTSGFDDDEVVAEGTVGALDGDGGEATSFRAGGDEAFTVWIQTDGISEENRREHVIAATRCLVDQPGGEQAEFQGNRQGSALTVEDDSTVGWFTASEGENTVACHQEPFGRQRTWLADEHGFVVVPGKPASPLGEIVTLSLGVALLAGIGLVTRGVRGRVATT